MKESDKAKSRMTTYLGFGSRLHRVVLVFARALVL